MPTRPVVVRAAPTRTGVSRPRLPSASPACCDRPGMESFHLHPVMQRLVAHEVPDPGAEPDPEDAADAARACRAAHPRLRPARHHHLVRRAGDRHRPGHRALQARGTATRSSWPSSSTSPAPTPTGELHLVMDNYAAHKHPKVQRLAGREPADPRPLHPDLRIVAEPGRGLVRHHRTPSHPPRHLHLRPRPDDQDPDLHRRLERPLPTLHLDQDRRRRSCRKPTVQQLQFRPTRRRSLAISGTTIT